MEKCCSVIEAIGEWYRDVEEQVKEIKNDTSKIDEIVELRIDGIKLSEYDLEDISLELEGFYYDFESPIVDSIENGGVYYCKKIQFDRFFDETFEYEDESLLISTGFKFEYWRRKADDAFLDQISEELYKNGGKKPED